LIIPLKIFIREAIIKSKERKLSRRSGPVNKNTLMILRTDAIGDYILFRNFIKVIRDSNKFRDYRITLCGNLTWKELAEGYDSGFVDDFIWIDNSKFLKRAEWIYTYEKLDEIHSKNFELLIDPNPLKTHTSEYIKRYSGAERILDDAPVELRFFANKLVSLIARIEATNQRALLDDFFQFYSNKKFVDSITESVSDLTKSEIVIDEISEDKKFIILFPGAGSKNRIWSPKRFAELCKLIRKSFESTILICGDSKDIENAQEIIQLSGISDIENKAGKTSLPELVKLIATSALLISNETCAVHIAAAVGAKAICLSNGNHFGRFNPYPKSLANHILTLYPPEISERLNEFEKLAVEYAVSSTVDINNITAEQVFNAVAFQLNGTILQKD